MCFTGASLLLCCVLCLKALSSCVGYVFTDSTHISPYLEDPLTGPTSLFCRQLAQRLSCYVVAGFPERLESHESSKVVVKIEDYEKDPTVEVTTVEKEVHQVGANSAVVYGPDGARLGDYRKTNLFTTDMTWAKPGMFRFHI